MASEQMRKSVLQRLGTIRGHISGIEKMVEENKKCEEVLFQSSAVMGAMNKLSAHILDGYATECLNEVSIDDAATRQRIEDLTKMMISMLKK